MNQRDEGEGRKNALSTSAHNRRKRSTWIQTLFRLRLFFFSSKQTKKRNVKNVLCWGGEKKEMFAVMYLNLSKRPTRHHFARFSLFLESSLVTFVASSSSPPPPLFTAHTSEISPPTLCLGADTCIHTHITYTYTCWALKKKKKKLKKKQNRVCCFTATFVNSYLRWEQSQY